MVLIGLGASIADVMQCYTVSRKGYGSMAISNSVGSQILNICVGLGLPWTIKGFSSHQPVHIPGFEIVSKAGFLLGFGSLVLIGITLGPALIYRENKCRLGNGKGLLMTLIYVLCIAVYSVVTLSA